jgi:hypothetical protein
MSKGPEDWIPPDEGYDADDPNYDVQGPPDEIYDQMRDPSMIHNLPDPRYNFHDRMFFAREGFKKFIRSIIRGN